MSDENEMVRQLNLRNACKVGSPDWEKHNERVEAYAHCPYYALYMGNENAEPITVAKGETIEVLSGRDKKDRVEALAAVPEKKAAKGK